MAHSAASEGRRRLDRRTDVQPMCGYISKKVGQVKEESNGGAVITLLHGRWPNIYVHADRSWIPELGKGKQAIE